MLVYTTMIEHTINGQQDKKSSSNLLISASKFSIYLPNVTPIKNTFAAKFTKTHYKVALFSAKIYQAYALKKCFISAQRAF